MTDKQIIIDGVDVSGCVRLQDDNYSCGLCGVCEGWKTCNYKQLKRKEQECEELNNDNHTLSVTRQKLLDDLWIAEESLKDFKELCDKQCEQLDQLKAENDELKRELMQYEKDVKDLNYCAIKLKQTLTEIKEYCTDMKKDHYWGMRMMRFANEVLQKISEVEE